MPFRLLSAWSGNMSVKKEKFLAWFLPIFLAFLFWVVHSTPHMAVRTQVFFMGYPAAAIKSGIVDDEYHNEVDRAHFDRINAKAYTLTEPPTEEATQGLLRNYLVRRYGIFYLADYYGET